MPPFLFDQNKFENHAYCITATSYSSRLPVQVLLILPNLWILGFAMSVPQVEYVVFVFWFCIFSLRKHILKDQARSWMKPWWKSCQISKPCIDEVLVFFCYTTRNNLISTQNDFPFIAIRSLHRSTMFSRKCSFMKYFHSISLPTWRCTPVQRKIMLWTIHIANNHERITHFTK